LKNLLPEEGGVVDVETEENIKWAGGALYVGGGDTVSHNIQWSQRRRADLYFKFQTVSVLTSFFLLMIRYPDIQRRAQADVDNVAPDHLPTFDDYDSLLYIRAMIKEIIRWAPVALLGLSHAVLEDDVYENYFIPKGTRVIANIWYIFLCLKLL